MFHSYISWVDPSGNETRQKKRETKQEVKKTKKNVMMRKKRSELALFTTRFKYAFISCKQTKPSRLVESFT